MKQAFILFLFLISMLPVSARTSSPATLRAARDVAYLFEVYQREQGKIPGSWQELAEKGYLSGKIWENSEELLNMDERYMFVDLNPIQIGNESHRILLMAKKPGSEGNDFETSVMDRVQGRLVMIEDKEGRLVVRKYSEKVLNLWFTKAGLNLADYTSDAPPSPSYNLGKEIGSYFRVRPGLKISCFLIMFAGAAFIFWKFLGKRDLAENEGRAD